MSNNTQDRAELERHWHEQWSNAKLDLENAKAHLQSIKQSGINPDEGDAYRAAIELETAALIEYSRVLRIYTDLVLHGKIPDEDEDAKGKAAS